MYVQKVSQQDKEFFKRTNKLITLKEQKIFPLWHSLIRLLGQRETARSKNGKTFLQNMKLKCTANTYKMLQRKLWTKQGLLEENGMNSVKAIRLQQ